MKVSKTGWTITGIAAAAVTVGLAGNALAGGGGGDRDVPGAITLQDRVPVEVQEFTPEEPGYEVIPRPVFQADDHGNFDSLTASLNSPDGAAGVDDTLDSPDDTFNSPASVDSPDNTLDSVTSVDGPDDTLDSPDDTFDSPASVDSPDNSPDQSVDSIDSPDNSA